MQLSGPFQTQPSEVQDLDESGFNGLSDQNPSGTRPQNRHESQSFSGLDPASRNRASLRRIIALIHLINFKTGVEKSQTGIDKR